MPHSAVYLAIAIFFAPGPGAHADIFHLQTGGTVNGQLLETTDKHYRIRTVVGVVSVPVAAVERIEPAVTPFEEYDQRVRQTADTPEEQTALGVWCDEQGLRAECRKHLLRAIELNFQYEPARRALGHVRVGDLWVDARTVVGRGGGGPQEAAETDPERLALAIQRQWYRQIHTVKSAMLDSGTERLVKQGRERILNIHDPLAIFPLTDVLSRGDAAQRALLVEALSAFREDEATMNLALVALLDEDSAVWRRALAQLVQRADPRVTAQYREALTIKNEDILLRAAECLGELKAADAVPDLIELLTVRANKWVEVPVRTFVELWSDVFCGESIVGLGPVSVGVHTPRIGIYLPNYLTSEWRRRPVTVYRTQVLEALRRITGQNLGFDRAEWQHWYEAAGKKGT